MFQLLLNRGNQASVSQYLPWIERLDQLCITLDHDNTLDDLVHRLTGGLELAYLNYAMSNVNSGYSLVRRLAPTFMQIAFADPTLWPRQASANGISLAHTLASPQLELGRYVFMEAVSGFMFGIPPLVEYETSYPPIRTQETHMLEWVHGRVLDFVIGVVKMNVWRARDTRCISEVMSSLCRLGERLRPVSGLSVQGTITNRITLGDLLRGWRRTRPGGMQC
ncbi:hypothetical protein FRC12_002362 [Ceratobasidium sp. 428]|nr:hypothetical protein FRC12_002362 [Ceratobasidium sp. 428]